MFWVYAVIGSVMAVLAEGSASAGSGHLRKYRSRHTEGLVHPISSSLSFSTCDSHSTEARQTSTSQPTPTMMYCDCKFATRPESRSAKETTSYRFQYPGLSMAFVFLLCFTLVHCQPPPPIFQRKEKCISADQSPDINIRYLTEGQKQLLGNSTVSTELFSEGERCAITACQKWTSGTRWGCHMNKSRFPYFGRFPPPTRLAGK